VTTRAPLQAHGLRGGIGAVYCKNITQSAFGEELEQWSHCPRICMTVQATHER